MQLPSTVSINWIQRLRELAPSQVMRRGLPEHAELDLRVRWPLYFVPLVIVNQLLTPHPVWIVLAIVIPALYGVATYWLRQHARAVTLSHARIREQLVVGDSFEDEFEIRNNEFLPVLWAEMVDYSRFPGKKAGQVVACGGNSNYRWRRTVRCDERGVYRLGPYALLLSDPFGLLALQLRFDKEEVIVIYPRVVQLQAGRYPQGQSTGVDRRRRSVLGATPAYSVLEYQPGDSLRRIHWRVTAHRGRLMVRELETEPIGDIWIVLDLYAGAQSGTGALGTLEFGIVAAASLAASLLGGAEGRAVGLVAHSGATDVVHPDSLAATLRAQDAQEHDFAVQAESVPADPGLSVVVRPKGGAGHLWEILTALAPVQSGTVPLAQLLLGSREMFGPRSTLLVVTPHVLWSDSTQADSAVRAEDGNSAHGAELAQEDFWPANLLHLRSGGLDAHAVLIEPHGDIHDGDIHHGTGAQRTGTHAADLQNLLLAQRVQTRILEASPDYIPLLTQRRRRRVVRSTPSGGAVTVEIEEAAG